MFAEIMMVGGIICFGFILGWIANDINKDMFLFPAKKEKKEDVV